MDVIVVGGGAAGFFGAVTAAERGHSVTILEASASVLSKVRVSGGGRCNVTHSCFDAAQLVEHYPRGGKALRGPFSRFQPRDTVNWFESRGVRLKTEADGRMFPTTDDSLTIMNCLRDAARHCQVSVLPNTKVTTVNQTDDGFQVHTKDGPSLDAQAMLLATGGARHGHEIAKRMGHEIVPPVPSLFTFHVSDPRIEHLSGISVEAVCSLPLAGRKPKPHHRQQGPLLITHWGFSGPSVLKLSAWAARELHDCGYQADLNVDWVPSHSHDQIMRELRSAKQANPRRLLDADPLFHLPRRLWAAFAATVLATPTRWSDVSRKSLLALQQQLKNSTFRIHGKSAFKEEFVTCGGVRLSEVDFRTMESRLVPNLYFAGEILDIDGITGGFNFQNAWTTAWLAGNSMPMSDEVS